MHKNAAPLASRLTTLLSSLQPSHLELINESRFHSKNPNGESHFKLQIVSNVFEGKNLLARHRLIMETVQQVIGATGLRFKKNESNSS